MIGHDDEPETPTESSEGGGEGWSDHGHIERPSALTARSQFDLAFFSQLLHVTAVSKQPIPFERMHKTDRDPQSSAGCLLEKFMPSALVRKEQRSPESKGISMGITKGISQRTEPSTSTNLEPHLDLPCQLDDFTVDGEYDPSAQLRGRRSPQVSSSFYA
jgi:hypothetical protein